MRQMRPFSVRERSGDIRDVLVTIKLRFHSFKSLRYLANQKFAKKLGIFTLVGKIE